MDNLKLNDNIGELCNRSIVITGSARTGTTIIGKILHSFNNVEYCYESPTLISLFYLFNRIKREEWRLLYETYLYEEFLINTIAGRSINCNLEDDSSIWKVKPKKEIEKRINHSFRKNTIEKVSFSKVIAYKIPDIIPFLSALKGYYPGSQIIVMRRRPSDVFHSLLEKKWFTDQSLSKRNLIWPFQIFNNLKIPLWVHDDDIKRWAEMTTIDRIGYYYVQMNKHIGEIQDSIIIDFDHFVEQPLETANDLCAKLGLCFGDKTENILQTVKRRRPKTDMTIINRLSSAMREKVEFYSP